MVALRQRFGRGELIYLGLPVPWRGIHLYQHGRAAHRGDGCTCVPRPWGVWESPSGGARFCSGGDGACRHTDSRATSLSLFHSSLPYFSPSLFFNCRLTRTVYRGGGGRLSTPIPPPRWISLLTRVYWRNLRFGSVWFWLSLFISLWWVDVNLATDNRGQINW